MSDTPEFDELPMETRRKVVDSLQRAYLETNVAAAHCYAVKREDVGDYLYELGDKVSDALRLLRRTSKQETAK